MFHFCNLAKAIGDENRVRILMALKNCPLCVCQLTALLDLAPSTTSKHLSILRHAQLIECVKNGRWSYYQLPVKPASESIAKAIIWVQESVSNSTRIQKDNKDLKKVLETEKGAFENQDLQELGHSAYFHSLAEQSFQVNLDEE